LILLTNLALDNWSVLGHNSLMVEKRSPRRKKRSDRTHLVYELTVGRKTYIGITVLKDGSVAKTMRLRIVGHWYKAHVLNETWKLSEALRTLDAVEDVEYRILGKARGKAPAHSLERDLIAEHKPKLNTDIRPKKNH